MHQRWTFWAEENEVTLEYVWPIKNEHHMFNMQADMLNTQSHLTSWFMVYHIKFQRCKLCRLVWSQNRISYYGLLSFAFTRFNTHVMLLPQDLGISYEARVTCRIRLYLKRPHGLPWSIIYALQLYTLYTTFQHLFIFNSHSNAWGTI